MDKTDVDQVTNHRKSKTVAIDAKPFNHNPQEQYSKDNVLRELNKAFLGFKSE